MARTRYDRKTEILALLVWSRDALRIAAEYRAEGDEELALSFVGLAREHLASARRHMVEAPASSRRRWKAGAVINARKRVARRYSVNHATFRGRPVYQSLRADA
jgi:hypothetical protein